MTTGEFAELVERMRIAQKTWFRSRATPDLYESKNLEKQVDKAIAERKARLAEKAQGTMF